MVAANQTKALREGANVMLIIGCDFHPGFQQIGIFDNQTGAYEERRLSHRAEAEQFYCSLAGQQVRVGMEACGHYPWLDRLLVGLGLGLWLWGGARGGRPAGTIPGSSACWPSWGSSCGWGMRPKSGPAWCGSRRRTGGMRNNLKILWGGVLFPRSGGRGPG